MSVNINHILLLFGDNPVSYNACAALYGSEIKTLAHLPKSKASINPISSKFHQISKSRHDWHENEYVEELIAIANNLCPQKKILVQLTNDQSIEFWLRYQDKLSSHYEITSQNIALIYNKKSFYEMIESIAPTIPKANKGQFPYIIKPALKGYFNQPSTESKFQKLFGKKYAIINDSQEESQLLKFQESELVMQELVDLAEYKEMSWIGYRSHDELTCYQLNHLKRNHRDRISELEITEVSEKVQEIAKNVLEKTNYYGICDIQMFFNAKTSQYYVIEMNPRLWCGHEILLMNQINLIKKMAYDHYNINSKPINTSLNKPSIKWFSWLYVESLSDYFRLQPSEFFNLKADNILFRFAAFGFGILKSIINIFTHRTSS